MKEKVYLTFKTEKEVSELLKFVAKECNMTQPELIEDICKTFLENLNNTAKQILEKENSLGS